MSSGTAKSPAKTLLRVFLSLIGVLVLAFLALIIFLSLTEYRPAAREAVEITVSSASADSTDSADATEASAPGTPSFTMVSWNIGYGALGDNADFFMDGGKSVNTASRERVMENLSGITDFLKEQSPDFILLQETDINSSRSNKINEEQHLADALPGYSTSFAYNFNVSFLPYPIPPIGHVESGLVTMSRRPVSSAERVQLPIPFSWPVRMANLKRCLLINRIPLEGSGDAGKELVLVNLHLEAYDDGEGKTAQTAMLREILGAEASAGNYVIAGGDFNQIFDSVESPFPVYEGKWQPGVMEAGVFSDSFSCLMDDRAASCRSLDQPLSGADLSTFQFYIIDGFLVSKNIEVEEFGTADLGFVHSDHNPVLLRFSLR